MCNVTVACNSDNVGALVRVAKVIFTPLRRGVHPQQKNKQATTYEKINMLFAFTGVSDWVCLHSLIFINNIKIITFKFQSYEDNKNKQQERKS